MIYIYIYLGRIWTYIDIFDSVNIIEGDEQDRAMTTGLHTIKDVLCTKCNTILGWIYVSFYWLLMDSNRY